MRLLKFLVFLLMFDTAANAADQFIINRTNSDVLISYVTCVEHYIVNEDGSGGGSTTRCNQEETVLVPVKKKIMAPWPDDGDENRVPVPPRSYDVKSTYLTSITSPNGKFEPIRFMSQEIWDATCIGVKYPNPPGCDESPIYLSRNPNSFAASGSSGIGRGGAWVIEDFDAEFVSMTFHPLGAAHMRS